MPEQAIKDKTAIAGIGWTPKFSRNSGTNVLNLTLEASLNAINDAGLSPKDIDGVVTFWWERDTIYPRELVEALGLEKCNFQLYNGLGGGWASSAVASAAMAVYAGMCKNVLVFRSMNGRSERPDRAERTPRGAAQWTLPYGQHHAAANYGPQVVAHMAKYGTTTTDLGHLAVTQRQNASLNTKAQMRTPISLEDHENSPWVVYPFRLLDCCLQTDGAVAMVVTSSERARDMKQTPIYISSIIGGATKGAEAYNTYAETAAPQLYEGAGITPSDVDVAELYDPFTGMALLHMEGFGLVEEGEAGPFVRSGGNKLDGELPINTHGGLLSEGYMQGLGHVIEAVQQLRPGGVVDDLCEGEHTFDRATCRQVRGEPEIALCCGECGESSIILRR